MLWPSLTGNVPRHSWFEEVLRPSLNGNGPQYLSFAVLTAFKKSFGKREFSVFQQNVRVLTIQHTIRVFLLSVVLLSLLGSVRDDMRRPGEAEDQFSLRRSSCVLLMCLRGYQQHLRHAEYALIASLQLCVSSLHRDHANLLCVFKRLFNVRLCPCPWVRLGVVCLSNTKNKFLQKI